MTVALALEYERVFVRERGPMGLDREAASRLVDLICGVAVQQRVYFLWRHQTPDPKDACVLEAAVAAPAGTRLVTHNLKDFREASSLNVEALTPAAFLRALRREGVA